MVFTCKQIFFVSRWASHTMKTPTILKSIDSFKQKKIDVGTKKNDNQNKLPQPTQESSNLSRRKKNPLYVRKR